MTDAMEIEKQMAVRLMQTYFAVSHGVRNFDWDWRDDRYNTWLHIARTALEYAQTALEQPK